LTGTLTEHLRPKSLLLVLDNCEHLLTACAQLAESLLRACVKLRVLASSREGLGIAGEQTYRVPSLSLPDPKEWSMVDGPWSMAEGRPRPHQPSTRGAGPAHQPRREVVGAVRGAGRRRAVSAAGDSAAVCAGSAPGSGGGRGRAWAASGLVPGAGGTSAIPDRRRGRAGMVRSTGAGAR